MRKGPDDAAYKAERGLSFTLLLTVARHKDSSAPLATIGFGSDPYLDLMRQQRQTKGVGSPLFPPKKKCQNIVCPDPIRGG